MTTLVLLSGGLDSAVCLADLVRKGQPVRALTIEYGQINYNEILCASKLCRRWDVPHDILSVRLLDSDVRHEIPARNLIFIAHALQVALITGMDTLTIGAEPDATYLDSSLPYLKIVRSLLHEHGVLLTWPVKEEDNKLAIVRRALDLGVPLSLVHPSRGPAVDGSCGTSKLFLAALDQLLPAADPQVILRHLDRASTEWATPALARAKVCGTNFKGIAALFTLASIHKPERSYEVWTTGSWGTALEWAAKVLKKDIRFHIRHTKDPEDLKRNVLNTDSEPAQWGLKQVLGHLPRVRFHCRVTQGHLRRALLDLGNTWDQEGVEIQGR